MNPQLVEITHGRTNPGIDPVLHAWGWEVPVYLFLGGLVAGVMVLLAALELQRRAKATTPAGQAMPFVAIGLISLGMGALFLDLAHKVHVYRFYLSFEATSPMSWGAWILMIVYPVLLLQGLGGLSDGARDWLRAKAGKLSGLLDRVAAFADAKRRPILWTSMAVGAGLGVYTGLLLGTLSARLLWNSAVMGPLFLASGVSTGAALLLCVKLDHEAHHTLVRWDTVAIGAELALLAVLLLGLSTGGSAQQVAADTLLGGRYTPYFWSLVVVGGLAVPLVLNLVEMRRGLRPTLLTPALVLIGGFALRTLVVAAGQTTGFGLLP
ncbi:MAG: polysulfide reductase NrfD [Myxococcales bacterium]|nr:polysulfide reductase NrfD [Myxococcales bacterium]